MKMTKTVSVGFSVLLLSGCASTPMGPTVQALPAQGKPFDTFQMEQMQCKQYAGDQVRGQAQNANEMAIGGAVLGTALGAGLGAAVGGGHGAAVGAAAGSVVGTGRWCRFLQPRTEDHSAAIQRCLFAMHVCKGQSKSRRRSSRKQRLFISSRRLSFISQLRRRPSFINRRRPPTVVYEQAPPPRY